MLGALRRSGMADRTTVLFCADHGEMLGERGLWYKMSFFEQSARVPLIVRVPGAGARRVAEPVSLLDVTPTLLELAGLPASMPPAAGLEGRSRASPARSPRAAPAPARPVVSEYHAEGVTAPAAMVRDGRFKLIRSLEDPDLLYDLEADPLELTDLSGAPEHADMVARLGAALEARVDLAAVGRRVLASQRERHLVSAALARGVRPDWDFEPDVGRVAPLRPQPRRPLRAAAPVAAGDGRPRRVLRRRSFAVRRTLSMSFGRSEAHRQR